MFNKADHARADAAFFVIRIEILCEKAVAHTKGSRGECLRERGSVTAAGAD